MNLFFRIFVATSVALGLSGAALSAADHGNENGVVPYDGPRVVFFERPNFRGESIEFKPGEEVPNLATVTFPDGRRANDAISSIYIEPGAVVVVNTDSRFRGEPLRLTQSVENLADISTPSGGTWADAVSSLRVEAAVVVVAPRRGGGMRDDREPRVVLYREPNFRGELLEVFPGENYDNLNDVSFDGGRNANDAISSVRIVGGVRLRAFSSSDYREDTLEVTESIPDLGSVSRSPNGGGAWSDCISSLRVERVAGRGDDDDDDNNRDRDRDRGGYNRPGPDREPTRPPPVVVIRPGPRPGEIEVSISRIFREMLSRSPSEIEIREYRAHMIEDGWTTEMVREDIRHTREYRLRDADVVIVRSYQDLLGRRPDPSSMDECRELVMERGYSEQQLRERIRRSPEFREYRRREADRIITRAFQDLLGRRPDAEGLGHYRELMIDRGFSEQQIRERIRDSDEFKQREIARVDAIITRLYRELLGRDPDPEGLQHRRHAMLDDGQTEKQMRDAIKNSDEYRARQAQPRPQPQPPQPTPPPKPRPNSPHNPRVQPPPPQPAENPPAETPATEQAQQN